MSTGYPCSFLMLLAGLAGAAIISSPPAMAEDCTKVHEIAITHTFNPGDIYAKVGECIHFTNTHMIEHSAVGMEREFNTGILMPGGTALLRFDEPIVIPYNCGVHPPMVGVLIIEPAD